LQYTIEARELTSEYTHRPTTDDAPRRTQVEARTADDAIAQFVRENASELVNMTTPLTGRESIATVKRNDSVYLVRVYAG